MRGCIGTEDLAKFLASAVLIACHPSQSATGTGTGTGTYTPSTTAESTGASDTTSTSDTSAPPDTTTGGPRPEIETTGTGTTTLDTTTTTEGTETDTTTGDPESNPDCLCVDDGEALEPLLPKCVTWLASAHVGCDSRCPGNAEVSDPAALDAVLVALRDRTPGLVNWNRTYLDGQYTWGGYALIKEDGTAIHRSWNYLDLGGVVSNAILGLLPEPDFFEGCLALVDPLDRFACLESTGVSGNLLCDMGGEW